MRIKLWRRTMRQGIGFMAIGVEYFSTEAQVGLKVYLINLCINIIFGEDELC